MIPIQVYFVYFLSFICGLNHGKVNSGLLYEHHSCLFEFLFAFKRLDYTMEKKGSFINSPFLCLFEYLSHSLAAIMEWRED